MNYLKKEKIMDKKKALFYVKLPNKKVQCELCGHSCLIEDSKRGKCFVRQNIDGELYSLNYGKITALNVDNIEKKPLYHFMPGAKTISLASRGCNFNCEFCQNHHISQLKDIKEIDDQILSPEDIVKIAVAKNIKIISYTYTEPTVFYEFMLETAMLAKASNIKNVMVSNGFMAPAVLGELLKCIDAFNIDLKSFRTKTYEKIGGRLDLVLNNLQAISKSSSWLEITTLLIPGFNDSPEEIEDISSYIVATSKDIPWHISAYHRAYKSNYPDTSLTDMKSAYALALASKLKNIYLGNIGGACNTKCFKCGEDLIYRNNSSFDAYANESMKSLKGKCFNCGEKIAGVF